MGTLDISIVILFLLATLWVGYAKGKSVKTFKDFAVGNKNYSLPILVSTTAATWIGGGDSSGLAGEVFKYGFPLFFVYSIHVLADLFVAFVIAPRMQNHNKGISLGDMVEPYYGKAGRMIISSAGLIKTLGALVIQVSALGVIFQAFLNIPFNIGACLSMSIIIAYTTFGGIRSVVFTDVLQFIFLVVSVPTIANLFLTYFGGFPSFLEKIPETHTSFLTSEGSFSFFLAIAFMQLIPGLNPLIMHRFFLNKDATQMKKSLIITAAIEFPFFFFVSIIGLTALLLFPDIDPNTAFPHLVNQAFL